MNIGANMQKICVISMSGGLDSTTLAIKAINEGYKILPVNFYYEQLNDVEIISFQNLMDYFKYEEKYKQSFMDPIFVDISKIYDATETTWKQLRDKNTIGEKTDLEFYTPSRNLLFSVIISVIGEITSFSKNISEISIGLGIHKHLEYKNYWDITPEFAKRLQYLFDLNTDVKITFFTPYVDKTKSDIINDVIKYNVPWNKTWTCYSPVIEFEEKKIDGDRIFTTIFKPCQKCEACIERKKAGEKVGIPNINDYEIKKTFKAGTE
jgi:7-cyano-7-deazaguanine synthase